MKGKLPLFIIVIVLFSCSLLGQSSGQPQDSTGTNRIKWTALSLSVGYGSSTYLLNNAWYSEYQRSSFHFFNDWREWENMDKIGHVYSAQFQSIYAYNLYKWSGLENKKAILFGSLTSILFQSTIEVLDGFSSKWGFSVFDFGANLTGTSLFAFQQSIWNEQRIMIKMGGGSRIYSGRVSSTDNSHSLLLSQRANDLFGSSFPSRFLKDYNEQTYWLSINLSSFGVAQNLPKWLNIAVGYGAENMYGGFNNSWVTDGMSYNLDGGNYKRFHQFYLSPDIDLTKIKTKSKVLKSLLGIFNIFKIPLPTIELTSNGKLSFYPLKF